MKKNIEAADAIIEKTSNFYRIIALTSEAKPVGNVWSESGELGSSLESSSFALAREENRRILNFFRQMEDEKAVRYIDPEKVKLIRDLARITQAKTYLKALIGQNNEVNLESDLISDPFSRTGLLAGVIKNLPIIFSGEIVEKREAFPTIGVFPQQALYVRSLMTFDHPYDETITSNLTIEHPRVELSFGQTIKSVTREEFLLGLTTLEEVNEEPHSMMTEIYSMTIPVFDGDQATPKAIRIDRISREHLQDLGQKLGPIVNIFGNEARINYPHKEVL